MLRILKKKINDFSIIEILLIYFIALIFFTIFAYFYCNIFISRYPNLIDNNGNLLIEQMPFDFGGLIKNLYEKNIYSQKIPGLDFDFYLSRMPLYPILITILAKINLNFYFIFFIKNILSFSIIFFVFIRFLKTQNKLLFHLIILSLVYWYNPYNTNVLLNISYSDTLVSVFVPLMLILVITDDKLLNYFLALFICCLYFLKPSLWIICVFFPFLFFILNLLNYKTNYYRFFLIPILIVFLNVIVWGLFALKKANYFAFGSSANSTNTYYLTALLNKNFNEHYPQFSMDILLDNQQINQKKFNNEKEFYLYFKEKNIEFIKNNLAYYLKGIFIKIKFILTNIYVDGEKDDLLSDKKIRLSEIPNKIILIFSLIIAGWNIIQNLNNRKKIPYLELIYLSIFFLYIAPHIIAWATTKHLVPIYLLSNLYLVLKIFRFDENKNNSNL